VFPRSIFVVLAGLDATLLVRPVAEMEMVTRAQHASRTPPPRGQHLHTGQSHAADAATGSERCHSPAADPRGTVAGAQTTVRVSVASDGTEANDVSMGSALSADGRFVAFDSAATDLVAGDTKGYRRVRPRPADGHDRAGERCSDGAQGNGSSVSSASPPPALSADGRFVAFVSFATNLFAGDTNGATDVFVHDRQTGGTRRSGRRL